MHTRNNKICVVLAITILVFFDCRNSDTYADATAKQRRVDSLEAAAYAAAKQRIGDSLETAIRRTDSISRAEAYNAYLASGVLELYSFSSPTCYKCKEIKASLLLPLEKKFAGRLKINYCDTENSEDYELMIRLERQHKISNPSPDELFLPDTFLLGFESIMANGRTVIEEYLNAPQRKVKSLK